MLWISKIKETGQWESKIHRLGWIQEMEDLLPPCRVKFLRVEKRVCSFQTEHGTGLEVAKIVCVSLSRVEFKGIG